MADDTLASAHDRLYEALNVMLTGDPAPVQALWSTHDDVTYAGPFGGFITGSAAVTAEFARSAAIRLGGRIEVSDVHMVEGTDMGYTACTEHGLDHVINGESVSLTHRATNIFRREPQGWTLVHHHTDASSSAAGPAGELP
ncbi:unannotated protein [freshwater metagenome]|uniref:Unannotated protein n=1 Tax=freshwater metagenome TaxID=449393 RepID=A0A6J7JS15_9ZZZZ|nr:DUF4440 domain-containing protein [Actinomycetota bacterium]MSW36920.1 DUF4440 domain-containing protein [Actinomycetota bacterium]MSX38960.1 DUF4440 domain-containing protein [Actinomycetota bacterium]